MSELTQGQVQWHCSEEDGGPDVGIAIGLGGNRQLWIGEILDRDGGGWGLVMYEPEKRLIDMKDYYEVCELFEDVIAPLMRDPPSDRIAELEARVAVLEDAGMRMAFAAGALNIATDSVAGLTGERGNVLDALKGWSAALNPSARSE